MWSEAALTLRLWHGQLYHQQLNDEDFTSLKVFSPYLRTKPYHFSCYLFPGTCALTDSVHGFPLVWSESFFFIVIVIRPISLICLSDSVHSTAHSGTRSIDICHTASVSGTMKLVFCRKLGSAEDMEHQFHSATDSSGMA